MNTKPTIAITMGDPGGIGPEIIIKALRQLPLSRRFYVLVIGSADAFRLAQKRCNLPFRINLIREFQPSFLRSDLVNFFDISQQANALYGRQSGRKPVAGKTLDIGRVSLLNAAAAYASLEAASRLTSKKHIQALVTAPVHKKAMRLVDHDFRGHTEYLAKAAGVKEYAMFFYSNFFCVTLATIHLPLKEVALALKKKDLVSKIRLTDEFLRRKIRIRNPKIAVSCLNPHGREFGTEEVKIIEPAVKEAQKKGFDVSGPLPGDQVFYDAYHKRFHAVLAMYHDQGLAPFKMLAFETGVNVTLGLPYVRTSPDHGTAFDIAYQNKANHRSFLSALNLAASITSR